jgi:hypothetical protein
MKGVLGVIPLLFTHHSVYADTAGAYEEDGQEYGEIEKSGFMDGKGLTFMN